MFDQKLDYIHYNPVNAGYVNYLSNTSIQVQGFIMRELMNGICYHILMESKVDVLWWLAMAQPQLTVVLRKEYQPRRK
jgi:hypothetical protein